MGYLPPVLRVAQVTVMKADRVPLLEINTLSAPLDLGALVHLKFSPSALDIAGWKLTTTRREDGRWDLSDWLQGPATGAGATASLRQIIWNSGTVRAVDPYGPKAPELVLSSMAGSWDPRQGILTTGGDFTGLGASTHLMLTAKGQGGSAPQWSGDLQLSNRSDSCAIHLDAKPGGWEAKGQSTKWPAGECADFGEVLRPCRGSAGGSGRFPGAHELAISCRRSGRFDFF